LKIFIQMIVDDQSMMINSSFALPVFVDSGTVVVDVEILGFWDETTGIDVDDDGRGGGTGGAVVGRWAAAEDVRDGGCGAAASCCSSSGIGVCGFFEIHCSIVSELTFCWMYVSRNSGCSPR